MLDVTDADADRRRGGAGRGRGRGGLAGLVNNAGVAVPSPLETIPIEDFRRQLEVNLTGQVAVTQALLRADPRAPAAASSSSARSAAASPPADRRLPRRQVRDRGGRRRLPPGAALVGDRGLDRRAGLDRHADLGARRAHRRRDRRPLAAARSALRAGDRGATARRSRKTAERGIPPEKVAKAVEHALSARRPRTRYLVGIDAKVQARLRPLVPTAALGPHRRQRDEPVDRPLPGELAPGAPILA